ncbi:hypothetical protein BJX61DRAFT_541060 [Aspergillus egyptiacus]|nr:hypothetical protein BJX61DRAFT_541060 [Aspergillus egyptiacus]
MTPIAIVGMSHRLPGEVKNDEEFWNFCCRAQSAWSEIPSSRFTAGAYYHPNPDRVGTCIAKGGYFLQEDVSRFDAAFFGITADEAASIDPQHRLLLECAYEALEYAGVSKKSLANEKVGVFAGGTNSDYDLNTQRDTEYMPRSSVGGTAPCFLANRVSHFFDLKGPSYTVDTACSSSLTALHAACQSLKTGESTSALVGACHLNLVPGSFISFSSSRLLGPSGKCHSFDHRATSGYGRGEGAGCVFLRPLDAALAAGDTIRAVIVNTGINQDGHTPIIQMPSSSAQGDLIRSVYEAAGINPLHTAYVEAHGTGTKTGDPVETRALHDIFGRDRSPKKPLIVGSAKSNFGHAEGASGMVANKLIPWPRDRPYASINNFGLGGANAHVILQKAPQLDSSQRTQTSAPRASNKAQGAPRRIFVLSGSSEQAVLDRARDLEVYLERRPELYDTRLMYNLAYTLGERRTMLPWKAAVSARTAKELITSLSSKEFRPRWSANRPRIAFVFPGQGTQWHAMGRELLDDYPVFLEAIQRVDVQLENMCAGFSVHHELMKSEEETLVSLPHISQTAITAVQIGLTDLLRSWGILPQAVIGHSSGEVPAAYAAGILSLEDAVRAAYGRGITALQLPEDFPGIQGAMIAVGAPVEVVEPILSDLKRGKAVVACINSGQNITVSGDATAVDELEQIVTERGIFNRKLKVKVAYHSHHIRLMADKYRVYLEPVEPGSSEVPFYSSARARRVDAQQLGPAYWIENGVSCVQFAGAMKQLLEGEAESCNRGKIDILVEIGPHPALASAMTEILQATGHAAKTECLPTLKRKTNATEAMHNLATALIVRGQPVQFEAINLTLPDGSRPAVLKDLPRYPWDHSTEHWHGSRLTHDTLFKPFPRHDLLGLLSDQSNDFELRWRSIVWPEDHPWIRDHRAQGHNAFPFTGFIVMAMEAARQRAALRKSEFDTYNLREVTVPKMLIMPDAAPVELTVCLRPYADGSAGSWDEVRICSWTSQRGWEENFRGLISTQKARGKNPVHSASHHASAKLLDTLTQMESICVDPVPTAQLYDMLEERGMQYDRAFRGMNSCFRKGNEAVTTLVAPAREETASDIPEAQMQLHPALLDLVIQAVWPNLVGPDGLEKLLLPSYMKEIVISYGLDVAPNDQFRAYSRRATPLVYDRPIIEDVWAVPESAPDNVVFQFRGIHMLAIHDDASMSEVSNGKDLCYRLEKEKCFDFMTKASLDTSLPSAQSDAMQLLERLAAFHLRNGIRSVSADEDAPGLAPNLRRFYNELLKRVSELEAALDVDPSNDEIALVRNIGPSGEMIDDLGKSLPEILRGQIDAVSAIRQRGGLNKYYHDRLLHQRSYQDAATWIGTMAGQKPNLRVLDAGSSVAATVQILANLPKGPRFGKYIRASSADASVAKESEELLGQWKKHVESRPLDFFADPTHQGFSSHSFDLVIVCHPPSNNPSLVQKIISCAHTWLEHGGKLLMVDGPSQFPLHHQFLAELLPGGWPVSYSGEDVDAYTSSLTLEQLDSGLRQSGFSGIDLSVGDRADDGLVLVSSARSKDPLRNGKVN